MRSSPFVVAALVFGVRAAVAQQAAIRGVVTDSSRAPVPLASVAVIAVHEAVRTDDHGRFVLAKLPVGKVEISVRRIGYAPRTVQVTLSAAGIDSLAVVLNEVPDEIEAMNVSIAERHRRQGVEDFYFRRAQGAGGIFITRDEILSQRASTPSDLLRTTPGLRLVSVAGGKGVRFSTVTTLRRGADCQPVMWVDGQRAANMEIDDIPLNDIEGIELYRGTSTTPGQFWQSGASQCGSIIVWTRIPGTP
ncbi:MAG: carboxypeptidase regulatory-like domain-containing protein [Gemmatimonadaceae bacterium]